MQEKGVLQELKDLWWKIPGEPCDRVKDDSAEMSMESLGGVFYTLYGGVLIGVFVALIEFWWEKSQAPYGERVSLNGKRYMLHGLIELDMYLNPKC